MSGGSGRLARLTGLDLFTMLGWAAEKKKTRSITEDGLRKKGKKGKKENWSREGRRKMRFCLGILRLEVDEASQDVCLIDESR
jgi:hypothetical protein